MLWDYIGIIVAVIGVSFILYTVVSFVLGVLTRHKLSINNTLLVSLVISLLIIVAWGFIMSLPLLNIILFVIGILLMYIIDRKRKKDHSR